MTTLSKEEYLKRYLDPVKSGDYKKKKKIKAKAKYTGGMKIVDDDIAWSKIAPKDDDIPDELLMREEMPKVEEIDERTQEERALDLYRKGDKWKMVNSEKTVLKHNTASARHDSDSDMNVPRRGRHDSSSESTEESKPRKQVRRPKSESGSDLDIKRRPRKRHDSSSDSMNGDVRNASNSYDFSKSMKHSDQSHRSIRGDNKSASPYSDRSNERAYSHSKSKSKVRRHDSSDSDHGLLGSRRHKYSSHKRKHGTGVNDEQGYSKSKTGATGPSSDSDLDLPRAQHHEHTRSRQKDYSDRKYAKLRRQQNSDSDLELPRGRHRKDLDLDLPRKSTTRDNKKTSSGASGGLTSRSELKKELQHKKMMESEMDNLARDSRNEATVFREKGGKKRDLKKEKEQKDAEDKEKEKKLKKYNQWGKGITQSEMKDYALEDLIHEANKPLARYADDADLDAFQRSQMRDGDPMAEYLAKKRSKEAGNVPTMPKYRGPAPAPNRYGIPPGYRWDGVDRSNGFEKKYFNSKSESGALKQEAYKWSVEDM